MDAHTTSVTISSVVDFLNSQPHEQAVIRDEYLRDADFTLDQVANETGRRYASTFEYHPAVTENMLLRDKVWVFAPKEDA